MKTDELGAERPAREIPESKGSLPRYRGGGIGEQCHWDAGTSKQPANGRTTGFELTDIAQEARDPDER